MIGTRDLAEASGIPLEALQHWRDLIAMGSGYTRVSIPQKRRRPRDVCMPSVPLDRLLKQLKDGLTRSSNYVAPDAVHGFVAGRDIVTNASQHLDQDVVLRVDLKDFFGTVNESRLKSTLTSVDFDDEAADAVSGVALVDGALAQGFSTSPILSNLAFFESDLQLAIAANETGARYTRYVDDLVFSGPQHLVNDGLLGLLADLLSQLGWTINHGKTRFMRRGKPQYVTGLYVGDAVRPHIPRAMKRLLRREVYFASRFGVADAQRRSPTPIDPDRLGGWVHYAAHADPVFGANLRSAWREVMSNRPHYRPTQDWDSLLDEIGFPDSW